MANVIPLHLSASTNGRAVLVAATATAGTLIHTATNTAGEFDEVWLYATNTSAGAVTLTIEWGGVTSPDDLIIQSIPGQTGLVVVRPGNRLSGGLAVRAFASVASVVTLSGDVNRYS